VPSERCSIEQQSIGVFVDFSRIFLLGFLVFKGLTARRLYESFCVKGLMLKPQLCIQESNYS
jgi:hypothetical protein